MRLLGDLAAFVTLMFLLGVLTRGLYDQHVAQSKGARLAPHVRRGRVPCSNPQCTRMMWTDHAWQAEVGPELYCSPQCVPHPQEGPST